MFAFFRRVTQIFMRTFNITWLMGIVQFCDETTCSIVIATWHRWSQRRISYFSFSVECSKNFSININKNSSTAYQCRNFIMCLVKFVFRGIYDELKYFFQNCVSSSQASPWSSILDVLLRWIFYELWNTHTKIYTEKCQFEAHTRSKCICISFPKVTFSNEENLIQWFAYTSTEKDWT